MYQDNLNKSVSNFSPVNTMKVATKKNKLVSASDHVSFIKKSFYKATDHLVSTK